MRSNLKLKTKNESPGLVLTHPLYSVPVEFSAFAIAVEANSKIEANGKIDANGKMLAFIDNNPESTVTRGRYKFPGGGVQVSDLNFFDAARRETLEETGLEVAAISAFPYIAEVKKINSADGALESIDYKVFILARAVGGYKKPPTGKNYERLEYTSISRLAGATSKGCAMQEWQLGGLIWAKQQLAHFDWRRQIPPIVPLPLTPQQLLERNLMPNQVFERCYAPKQKSA